MADFFPNGYFDPDYWGEGYFQASVAGSIAASLSGYGTISATLTADNERQVGGDDAGKPVRRRRTITQVEEYWVKSEAPYWNEPELPIEPVVPAHPNPVNPPALQTRIEKAVEAIDDDEESIVLLLAA